MFATGHYWIDRGDYRTCLCPISRNHKRPPIRPPEEEMKIELEEITPTPYRLTLRLSESELAQLQDTLHTVSILSRQFTDEQREQAAEIDDRISKIWRE